MLISSFKYSDHYNNEIVVTLEYVNYIDMKYTVIYCTALNTVYRYMDKNYIEVKRLYRSLLHDILTLGHVHVSNIEKLGFTILNELPF